MVKALRDRARIILGPPGSGKTHHLLHQLHRFLREDSGAAWMIAGHPGGVSGLEERASLRGKRLGRARVVDVPGAAAHQLGAAGNPVKVINPAVRNRILRQVCEGLEGALTAAEADHVVRFAKLQTTARLADDPLIAEVLSRYEQLAAGTVALDQEDLVHTALSQMQEGFLAPLSAGLILIDDYQNLAPIEHAWVLEHLRHGARLVATFDDDQIIEAWRQPVAFHGPFDLMDSFGATIEQLTGGRAGGAVFAAAQSVVAGIAHRLVKQGASRAAQEPNLIVDHRDNPLDEALAIVEQTQGRPDDWAVVARSEHHLDRIELALTVFGVPYQRQAGISVWHQDHVDGFIRYLGLLCQPQEEEVLHIARGVGLDAGAWNAVMPRMGGRRFRIGEVFVAIMLDELIEDHFEFVPMPLGFEPLERLAHQAASLMDALAHAAPVDFVIDAALATYRNELPDSILADQLSDIGKLLGCMDGPIKHRLGVVRQRLERWLDGPDRHGVVLTTIEAFAGRDSSNVCIPAFHSDSFPPRFSDAEEERRLLYQALTRARDRVYISTTGSLQAIHKEVLQHAQIETCPAQRAAQP